MLHVSVNKSFFAYSLKCNYEYVKEKANMRKLVNTIKYLVLIWNIRKSAAFGHVEDLYRVLDKYNFIQLYYTFLTF